MRLLFSVLKFLPDKKHILGLPITLMIIGTFLSFATPFWAMKTIDLLRVTGSIDWEHMAWMMCVWILAMVLVGVIEYFQKNLFCRNGQILLKDIYRKLVRKHLSGGMQLWLDVNAKEAADQLKKDCEDIFPLLSGLPIQLLRHIVVGQAAVMIMTIINWQLSLAVFLLLPFYLLGMVILSDQISLTYDKYRSTSQGLLRQLIEALQTIPTIKVFDCIKNEYILLEERFNLMLAAQYDHFVTHNRRQIYARFLAVMAPIYLAFIAYYFLSNKLASVGEIFGFWSIFTIMTNSFTGFLNQYTQLQKTEAIFTRISRTYYGQTLQRPNQNVMSSIESIICRGIAFRYKTSADFSLFPECEIKRGEMVEISGKSGAGKTTLLRLLLGLLEPSRGEILLNGCRRHLFSQSSFLTQVGYVEQGGCLYSRSLYDNIILGRPFDARQWSRTIELVQLEEFDHVRHDKIGENGICLSGGERQRVLIARALYHQPSWIFLDEPFTGIDWTTRQKIIEIIKSLAVKLTIIIVSHTQNHTLPVTQRIIL